MRMTLLQMGCIDYEIKLINNKVVMASGRTKKVIILVLNWHANS